MLQFFCGAVGDQPQGGGDEAVLLHPMLADVVHEASLILVHLDILIRNRHQCLAIEVVLQNPIVVLHHSCLGQPPLVSGGHAQNLVLVVPELVGVPNEEIVDDHALVFLLVCQAVLHHLQLFLLLPFYLLGPKSTFLATHPSLTSPGDNSAKFLSLKIKTNSKAFYTFAKSHQKTRAKIGPFIDPATGKPNQDPAYAAEVLRQQYNSVFSQPRPEWTVHDYSSFFQVQDVANTLSNIKFNHVDIELACEELSGNSAPGPDGVPALLLKECRKELSHPLTTFWRASLDQGVIPDELLLVHISPLHKGDSRADPAQFRPVALTSHLIKSFERVIRKVIARHLEGVFPDGQHGSRLQRSTLTQLLAHQDSVLDDLESNSGSDTIYLDFSKGYDKCETGVLLHKLKEAGIMGKVGTWMAAFLDSNHRQQAVVVDEVISALSPVISGVPQGTVTAPVLFLLMIADIAKGVSPSTRVSSFVDDTRVKKGISTPDTDCSTLQEDLQAIYQWADKVELQFNSKKFECLRYWPSGPAPEDLYLSPDGSPIEVKQHLRDLGVQLSSDCKFSVHIDNVVTAVSNMVGWVLRTFRSRRKLVMMTCLSSLLQSRLDYCCLLWSPNDQHSISKLESVAKQFTAHIEGMDGLNYLKRLKALGMYSQEKRREHYLIIFIWKLAMGLVKGYSIEFCHSPRRGWSAIPKPVNASAPTSVQRAREVSLAVKGVALFNLCPWGLRDMASDHRDRFKENLDAWLHEIPDQPSIPGCQRAAKSNSLLDQVPLMLQEFDNP